MTLIYSLKFSPIALLKKYATETAQETARDAVQVRRPNYSLSTNTNMIAQGIWRPRNHKDRFEKYVASIVGQNLTCFIDRDGPTD